jgi:hypothetical protein
MSRLLKRAWCWLAHRRDWARNTLGGAVCNKCGEVW